MQDAGIVRNRAKIEGAVEFGARLSQDHGERAGIFRHAVGARRRQADRPQARQPLAHADRDRAESRAMSKELLGHGFKFVGPTIVYAFMQAVGMVNDHLVDLPPPRGRAPSSPKRK